MKTFWKNVNKSILSGITTIVIFVMGFIWWIYRPEDTVPMKVFCLTIMVSYTVCVLVYAIALGEKEVAFLLPRVKHRATVIPNTSTTHNTNKPILFISFSFLHNYFSSSALGCGRVLP